MQFGFDIDSTESTLLIESNKESAHTKKHDKHERKSMTEIA